MQVKKVFYRETNKIVIKPNLRFGLMYVCTYVQGLSRENRCMYTYFFQIQITERFGFQCWPCQGLVIPQRASHPDPEAYAITACYITTWVNIIPVWVRCA
jgi:hypothetical protein